MTQVFYDAVLECEPKREGIVIPVTLMLSEGNVVRLDAKVDTGAEFCIFQRRFAEQLDINVEDGHRTKFSTVTGEFIAYGHELTLVVMGKKLLGTYYFYEEEGIVRNVLGRNGWLNKIRLGIDDTRPTGLVYVGLPE